MSCCYFRHFFCVTVMVVIGLFIEDAGAGAPASSKLATSPSISSAYTDFLMARASAEVCEGRKLGPQEEAKYVRSLRFRDPARRSIENLKESLPGELANIRSRIEKLGCDHPLVHNALFDWRFRVTLFAGISDKRSKPTVEAPTKGADLRERNSLYGSLSYQPDSEELGDAKFSL